MEETLMRALQIIAVTDADRDFFIFLCCATSAVLFMLAIVGSIIAGGKHEDK